MTNSMRRDDGTRQLLLCGAGTLAVGLLAAVLTSVAFGGIGPEGPHTNSGWLSLLIALMCVPFGAMALALGAAKWLRNRRGGDPPADGLEPPLNPVSRESSSLLSFSDHSLERRSHGKERQ